MSAVLEKKNCLIGLFSIQNANSSLVYELLGQIFIKTHYKWPPFPDMCSQILCLNISGGLLRSFFIQSKGINWIFFEKLNIVEWIIKTNCIRGNLISIHVNFKIKLIFLFQTIIRDTQIFLKLLRTKFYLLAYSVTWSLYCIASILSIFVEKLIQYYYLLANLVIIKFSVIHRYQYWSKRTNTLKERSQNDFIILGILLPV